MLRIALVSLALVIACKKEKPAETVAPPPQAAAPAAPTPDGPRRVAIDVGQDGYKPDKIPGKPGEKLVLVFTRTFDASCISQVKTPDGKMVDLPMNKPVEVAVTVPQTGEVGFACGMDMFHGVVIAQPAT
jgi:plastocyanin domain-containing protein